MIRSIDVRNFRCFKHLKIPELSRLNLIVGDNGAGKTALLESIFLTLGSSSEIGARIRGQRGLDGAFSGHVTRIEAALWGGLFYDGNMNRPISVTLDGEGSENRSLEISRRSAQEAVFQSFDKSVETRESPIIFSWRDHKGEFRTATPTVSSSGVKLPGTGEDLEDFFLFAANQTVGSGDNADRFSQLSQEGKHRRFVELFTKEYRWIADINVEVYGGGPVLFATLENGRKLPLPNISGGINRAVSFLLGIASFKSGVVIIDEIENGIHYSHQAGIWRALLTFIEEYNCQVFASTHSQECLAALSKVMPKNAQGIALLQMERGETESSVRQFSGKSLKLALEYHEEIR